MSLNQILFLYGSNDSYNTILFAKEDEAFDGIDTHISNTGCLVIVATEKDKRHLSISHPDRLPSYNEIKKARYDLCSDIQNMAQIFPMEDEYVNFHKYCLHLWEI